MTSKKTRPPKARAAHALTPEDAGAELHVAAATPKPKPEDRCPSCNGLPGCAQGTCTDAWHAPAKEGAR